MDVVFKTERAVFNYRVAGIWIVDDRVLLHKAVNERHWSLTGGRVEIAEEAKESIKREFLEELDVDISVNRLVWIAENFFEYNGMDIHELGLYFSVSSNPHPYAINSTPFYGMEGERLMYRWTPIEEIGNVELYPEFLRGEMSHLPNDTHHIVQRQYR
ncbi:NUDIX domain-containing protein [Mesobacillus foraminis]|uniref:NUDIX hydrolase n=1 Tax=Mesobacillus foraminis TaxID=279826 RepID=UPI001BEAA9DE|nr:NUDIX domain-containing protein [Mesobacillus foraminis]MBT2757589.1 NUDIX domain-containing protein [Mesobacillus foraminis]